MAREHLSFILLIGLLIPGSTPLMAQGDWDVGFSLGMANYMGDIGDGVTSRRDFIWDMQEFRTRPAFGLYARRKLDRDGLWHVRADISRIHISGSDKDTQYAPRRARNLHFRNHMTEGSIRLERDLLQKPLVWARQRRAMLTVRGFIGYARVQHNPEARVDVNNLMYDQLIESGITRPGQWHSLPELQTEGIDYSDELNIVTIPFGVSAIVTGQKRGGAADFYLGIELGFRMTDTDYLDDISSFYADPSEMTPLGAALSSQSNPIDINQAGPGSGSVASHSYNSNEGVLVIRGSATQNDAYGTLVITYGKVLNGRSQSFNRNRSTYGNKRGGGLFRKSTKMKF